MVDAEQETVIEYGKEAITEDDMISNVTIAGMGLAMAVSFLLPFLGVVYCVKKAGVRNVVMFILVGVVGAMLSESLLNILGGVLKINQLEDYSFILYLLLLVILLALADIAARILALLYMKKMDIGFYKAVALGVGFSIGQVFTQVMNYFMNIQYSLMINQGTFVDSIIASQNVTGDELETLRQDVETAQAELIALHPATFYVNTIEQAALVALNIAVIMLMVRFIRQQELVKGFVLGGLIILGYELLYWIPQYGTSEKMNSVISAGTELIISTVIAALILAGSIFLFRKLEKELPKEKFVTPTAKKKQQEDMEKEKNKKAWSEFGNLANRNLKKDVEAESSTDKDAAE